MSRIGIVLSPLLLCCVVQAQAGTASRKDLPGKAALQTVRWSKGPDGVEVLIETPQPASLALSWDWAGRSVRLELAGTDAGSYPDSVIDVGQAGLRRIRVEQIPEGTAVSLDFERLPDGRLRVRPVKQGIALTLSEPNGAQMAQVEDNSVAESSGAVPGADRDVALERRLAQLERRLASLEGRLPPGQAAQGPAPGESASTERGREPSNGAAATTRRHEIQAAPVPPGSTPDLVLADARPVYPNLRFAGFSNLDYGASQQDQHGNGFKEGQFVLHLSSPLSERVQVFGELALTARDSNFEASVERAIISLRRNDALGVSFGRMHTPISWWNTEYHHGLWLQTSIERPYMVNFGTRFLPIHTLGGIASGRIPSSPFNFEYEGGIGNGRATDLAEPAQAGDVNNHRSVLFRLAAHPGEFSRFALGASFYADKLTQPGVPDYRERIGSAFLAWTRDTPEIVAEYFHVRHTSVGSGEGFNSWAAYAQFAYRLPWLNESFKPYFRYEKTQVNSQDPVFAGFPGLRAAIVGLRYDFTLFAAFKAEYQRRRSPGTEPYNAGIMQLAFTF